MAALSSPLTPIQSHQVSSSKVPGPVQAMRRSNSSGDVGIVVKVRSFQEMEEAAQRREVKGILFKRPPLACSVDMEKWVEAQEESLEAFAIEKLFVQAHGQEESAHDHAHDEERGCCEPEQPCSKRMRIFGPEEVTRACKRLLQKVPKALAEPIERDAKELSKMLVRLCPGSSTRCLSMQVEVVGRNACQRWHQDRYISRGVVTYNGPGTWMVDDSSVRYEQFKATYGAPRNVSDPAIVPRFEDIHRPSPNDAALMKGSMWPGIQGVEGYEGLTHKSPNIGADARGNPVMKRLLLKVDLADD